MVKSKLSHNKDDLIWNCDNRKEAVNKLHSY